MSGPIVGLGGWLKNSFIDYPGTVSTVLFFNRCNLRCPYCHNPGFVDGQESIVVTEDDLFLFLEKRKRHLGGVVFTGGEPLLFTSAFKVREKMRQLPYAIKLDTNGLQPDKLALFSPDYCALDIKTDVAGYSQYLGYTAADCARRLADSVAFVKSLGQQGEIRITVAPRLADCETLEKIAALVAGVSKIKIQRLRLDREILDRGFFSEIENEPSYDSVVTLYRDRLLQSCGSVEIR